MRNHTTRRAATALATVIGAFALVTSPAAAGTGGVTMPKDSGTPGKAKLVDGKAIPPPDAPRKIVKLIKAANEIRNKPYKWGGGHNWNWEKDSGYDCSGAVSWALHGAGMLDTPLDSSGLMKWGKRKRGNWLTVFANSGHTYLVVAGLRFDTSMTPGDGPGWSKEMRSGKTFKKRHWKRL